MQLVDVPGSAWADGWVTAWCGTYPRDGGVPPLARTVVVEHHPELDALVMSGTDGALMVSTIVPLGDDLASPEWGEVRESPPASTTVVWDPDALGLVLARTVAKDAKADPDLRVRLTVGRAEGAAAPALDPSMERLVCVAAAPQLSVEFTAVDAPAPDWRGVMVDDPVSVGVTRIGVNPQILARLAKIPGVAALDMAFTTSSSAVHVHVRGAVLPTRAVWMPVILDQSGTVDDQS